jgi:hypothetical protein
VFVCVCVCVCGPVLDAPVVGWHAGLRLGLAIGRGACVWRCVAVLPLPSLPYCTALLLHSRVTLTPATRALTFSAAAIAFDRPTSFCLQGGLGFRVLGF